MSDSKPGPWEIQINWHGQWLTLERGFRCQGDAEWRVAEWMHTNGLNRDPFRAVKSDKLEVDNGGIEQWENEAMD